ncbi:MAG TPA: membrane protein insertion efficiency factor YidD [Acidiferrobacterales bacterium]|nr:membrane protein insertion efficiency factor YidD [Acidiferrobacterales bacterium]
MQKALILLLRGYRYWLSPWLGQHCRFYPSCSCYALDAIAAHGARKGMVLTCARLLRCHPWCAGGYDPVPGTATPRGARHG